MKRTFLFLLLMFVALYTKVGYDLWTINSGEASPRTEGRLSDIAAKVTLVPLQPANGYPLAGKPKCVRQEGNNLFFICEDVLYRFTTGGKFIGRITDPDVIRVAEYAIDPLRKQLIVLGNANDVCYYTFTGRPVASRRQDAARRMQAMAMYRNCIWTAEERLCFNPLTQGWNLEQLLVRYDASFAEIESHRLLAANLPDKPLLPPGGALHIAVEEDTGRVYAYSPALHPDGLLRDSLLLDAGWTTPGLVSEAEAPLIFPLRLGRRFRLASFCNPADEGLNYTFCFDRATHRSWQLKAGFEDDFYHTGFVGEWQAMDVYGSRYCFSRSSEEIFIVELKA